MPQISPLKVHTVGEAAPHRPPLPEGVPASYTRETTDMIGMQYELDGGAA